jgi:hypothetical protein
VFIPGFNRYLLATFRNTYHQTMFLDAPHPWGPWTYFASDELDKANLRNFPAIILATYVQTSSSPLRGRVQMSTSGYYQIQTQDPATNPYSFFYQELDFYARSYTPQLRYQGNAHNYAQHNQQGLLGGWTFNNLAYVESIVDTSGLGQAANITNGLKGEFSAQGLYTANRVIGPPVLQTTLAPALGDSTVFVVFKEEAAAPRVNERLWAKGLAGGNGMGVQRQGSLANQWCAIGPRGCSVCGPFPDKAWHLLVYVRQAGAITVYRSLSLVGNTLTPYLGPKACSASTTDTSKFHIASSALANTQMVGEVALFSVYNRTLSPAELAQEIQVIRSEEGARGITLP